MPHSDDEEETAETNPAYLALHTEHLDDFRAHLAGRDGSEPLPASYFPPNAFWSAAEKGAFFHALAVHSRLRPDLIAREVKTKTVPDVCAYIALLEQATREASRNTVYVGAENKPDDPRVPRKDLPIALEVSDDWLLAEERMADAWIASEPTEVRKSRSKERSEERRSYKRSLRIRDGENRSASGERDRAAEKRRRKELETWVEESRARWAAEDAWEALDSVSMAALDRILREEEEGHAVSDQPEDVLPDQSMGLETLPKYPQDFQVAEEHIDPALLELSRPGSAMSFAPPSESACGSPSPAAPDTLHGEPSSSLHPSSTHFHPSTPPFLPASHPIDAPFTSSSLPPAVEVSHMPLISHESSIADEPEEDPATMSPASRRRYQKRLYMRRKRAMASGGIVNENASRLKPGRKPKPRLPRKDHPRAVSQATMASSPTAVDSPLPNQTPELREDTPEGQEGVDYRHPKLSGMTLPYRRQLQFASIGIDAQHLHEEGLGLFHLQPLSKLMQLYNQLHDVPAEVASHVSPETIKVLHALVVQFVAEVMSRAITTREQDRIAKLQTKAWHVRENQNIAAIHVKHALALYGADSLDKRSHFAGLLMKLGLDGRTDGDTEGDDDDGDDDTPSSPEIPLPSIHGEANASHAEDAREGEPPLPPLSLLRTIFPPFIDLPPSEPHGEDIDGDVPLEPSTYMPWPSSSLLSTSAEPPREEDLLPEDIDEDALVAELLEEENIDKDDRQKEVEAENALWARFGGRSAHLHAPTAACGEDKPVHAEPPAAEKPQRKRKRKGKPRGRSVSVAAGKDGEDGEDGDGTESDSGEEGGGPPRGRARKGKARAKGKGTAHLNEDQLRFMEPDPNGRIKSSVYVLDSDGD